MRLDDFYPTPVSFEPNILDPFVPIRPTIKIRFNTELLLESINSSEKLNQYIILVEENSDTSIDVEYVGYSTRVLEFRPVRDLNPGSIYQVTVLREIQSSQGRSGKGNRNYAFQVSQSNVGGLSLLEPSNYTSVTAVNTFYWGSASTSGATGTLFYRIELDDTIAFKSVASNGWTTTTTATSAIIGVSLSSGKHYFWRVRGEFHTSTGSSIGQWSDPYVFYYGTFLEPSPSTRQTYPEAVTFQANSSYGLESGTSNQTTFPNLTFRFSTAIDPSSVNSSTVYMVRESVDGFPNTKYNVSIVTTISASSLTITPSDTIIPNSRYTIYITTDVKDVNGNYLTETVTRYFTSRYSPLYLGSNVVRANFGRFLIDTPEDLINFQIYRVSLDVNRKYIWYNNPLWGGPTEEQVRNNTFALTYPMERWVETEVGVRLLSQKYYELLETSDSMKRLGDYQEQHGSNILSDLSDEIGRLRKEGLGWSAQFDRHRARNANTRKSERWSPLHNATDFSFSKFRRDKI